MFNFMAKVTDSFNVPKPEFDENVVGSVLSIVFAVMGAVAVITLMLASLKYVVSRGEPAEVAKAKNAIIYSVIGLVVVASAFTIVSFVVGRI